MYHLACGRCSGSLPRENLGVGIVASELAQSRWPQGSRETGRVVCGTNLPVGALCARGDGADDTHAQGSVTGVTAWHRGHCTRAFGGGSVTPAGRGSTQISTIEIMNIDLILNIIAPNKFVPFVQGQRAGKPAAVKAPTLRTRRAVAIS